MEILDKLEPGQRAAVDLMRLLLRVYNIGEGTGLFSGVTRYHVLEDRTTIAAIQSRTIFEFISRMQRSLRWPSPPKKYDEAFVDAMSGDGTVILASLRQDAASIVMLARYVADQEKKPARELKAEQDALFASPERDPLDELQETLFPTEITA